MEEIDGTILPGSVLGSLAMAALFGAGAATRMETNQLFILPFSPFFPQRSKRAGARPALLWF